MSEKDTVVPQGFNCDRFCPGKQDCDTLGAEFKNEYDAMLKKQHTGTPQDVDQMQAVQAAGLTLDAANSRQTVNSVLCTNGPGLYLPDSRELDRQIAEVRAQGLSPDEEAARIGDTRSAMMRERAVCGNPDVEQVYRIISGDDLAAAALQRIRPGAVQTDQ